MVVKEKKTLDYFFVGFLMVAILANLVQHLFFRVFGQQQIVMLNGVETYNVAVSQYPWYINYEFGVIAGVIKLIGYVCIAIAAEWFQRENPEIKAITVVSGLSIMICLCYGACAVFYGGYVLGYWEMQDLYLPVRLRLGFIILKQVANLSFVIACYKWMVKKTDMKTKFSKIIRIVFWIFCTVTFLICMFYSVIIVLGANVIAYWTDWFAIVPFLMTFICLLISKQRI